MEGDRQGVWGNTRSVSAQKRYYDDGHAEGFRETTATPPRGGARPQKDGARRGTTARDGRGGASPRQCFAANFRPWGPRRRYLSERSEFDFAQAHTRTPAPHDDFFANP